ncbi:MAG: ABC transporter ATP-binding protein [Bacteroidales bacterium]|nr:ABC transporter ATP-binding protein [Bacteroidales bacterium]
MIEIKNISFSYPIDIKLKKQRPKVFDKFFLNFKENNIYGLLGKNGMGKSTLLYLINGLNDTQSGSIYIDGDMVTHRNPVTLSKIFLVPEEFDLPELSLKSYVKLNRAFYPDFSMEILENCLRDFELEDFGKLSGLSMGQKKKVYMSFALATNAKYLLMDEPTNGLDIPSKKQFRKVVAQNMTEDRTLIISTHQVHDLEQLLDHIVILGERQLLMDKPVADIMNEYVFEYRPSDQMDGVIYSEPNFQGNAVIAPRRAGDAETPVNIELLFNAVNNGKL